MPSDQTRLTSIEARNLLASGGANAVDDLAKHPARRALGKLWAPMPWMLEAAIVLQIAIGDYAQAGVVALLLITAISFCSGP
jgi:H+-transporting ATPase